RCVSSHVGRRAKEAGMPGDTAKRGAVAVVDLADKHPAAIQAASGSDPILPLDRRPEAGGFHLQRGEDRRRGEAVDWLRGDAFDDLSQQDVAEIAVDVMRPDRALAGGGSDQAADW